MAWTATLRCKHLEEHLTEALETLEGSVNYLESSLDSLDTNIARWTMQCSVVSWDLIAAGQKLFGGAKTAPWPLGFQRLCAGCVGPRDESFSCEVACPI